MGDAPKRIWACPPDIFDGMGIWHDAPSVPGEAPYILDTPDTPEAIAASPEVAKLVADAVAAERARCVEIAVRHWEGEPEDTIAMAAEMLVGMTSLTEYERKVTQMRENFPNGI